MELMDAIRKRRSVHDFTDKRPEDAKIGAMLEACAWAPSAGNRQPWDVIVVDGAETIGQLAKVAVANEWLARAPMVMVVCVNQKLAEGAFGTRGKNLYAMQSTAAAVQNMMLAATDGEPATC